MDLEGLVHDLAKNGFVHWRCICIEVHNPIEIVLGKNKVMYRYSFIKNWITILVSFFKDLHDQIGPRYAFFRFAIRNSTIC